MDYADASSSLLKRESKIGVLGMGHVGLPTALGLTELGWDVIGADLDENKIALLKIGQIPFYEPGLQELLLRHSASSRLELTNDVEWAIRSSAVLFLCVWTSQKQNGEADLTHLESLARTIARNLNGYKLIIEKCTVPAGTGQTMAKTIERHLAAEHRRNGKTNGNWSGGNKHAVPEACFDVASNPEFLQEGKAVEHTLSPHRVVCGTDSPRAEQIIRELYRAHKCPVLVTDLSTAELIKYAANAFLATKISFINMVADLCDAVGADIAKVAHGIGLDPRIGPAFLNAGIGFGGYCLPKDLRALIHTATDHGINCDLLKEVDRINQKRIDVFLRRVRDGVWVLRGKTIGVLGLSFKPGTDDIRESPSIRVIEALLHEGATLQLHDPQAMENFRTVFPEQPERLSYCQSAYEAARGAHALLLLTEWDDFRDLDLRRIHDLMEVPVLIDGRNVFDPNLMRDMGFEYLSIGREISNPVPVDVAA